MRRTKQMGLTHLGERPPGRVPDVEQRVVIVDPDRPLEPQLPRSCPKCRARGLMLVGRELRCPGARGGCGATFFLTTAAYMAVPDPGRGARSAHHQTARWTRAS